MSEQEELAEQLNLMLQKATRSLLAAQRLLEEDDYDFASSRAYYAAFYGIQAVLLTKNISASKHSGTIRLFNQHFIKTDIFPKEFNKYINDLFRNRQTSDYTFDAPIDQFSTRQDIQTAETILQAITDYLTQAGFLADQ